MKRDVVVVGCGVVGAAIAYQLSCQGLSVVVVDAADPACGSTGAALGVLMAVCSQQISGPVVDLRLHSLTLFDPLIAQLQSELNRTIPVNRRGILKLLQPQEESEWTATVSARQAAGWLLERLDPTSVDTMQAGLQAAISGGLYSPQDRQIDPRVFTHALIQAARQRGVQFHFQQPVLSCKVDQHRVKALYTPEHTLSAGAVILTAGLGSSSLGAQLGCQIPLRPVKGQAVQVYARDLSLGPVVTHDDVHCVPLADGSIWIGATVEFEPIHPEPTLAGLHSLIARAQWICPALSEGKLLHSWTGQRPRPVNQRAPILGFSPTVSNVVIATGHYRNGILLAPVTAQIVGDLVTGGSTQICDISFFRPNSANQQA